MGVGLHRQPEDRMLRQPDGLLLAFQSALAPVDRLGIVVLHEVGPGHPDVSARHGLGDTRDRARVVGHAVEEIRNPPVARVGQELGVVADRLVGFAQPEIHLTVLRKRLGVVAEELVFHVAEVLQRDKDLVGAARMDQGLDPQRLQEEPGLGGVGQ